MQVQELIFQTFQPTSFTGSVKVLRNSIIRCGSENQMLQSGVFGLTLFLDMIIKLIT